MKFLLNIFVLFLLTSHAFAQVPQLMNYQGIARDAKGMALENKFMTLRISIIEGANESKIVYAETHEKTTNNFGLYNLQIGGGKPIEGLFEKIEWASGNKYIKVELWQNNEWSSLGTTQLLSVPYALYAATAGNALNANSSKDTRAGTLHYLSKFDATGSSSSEINSQLFDNGTSVGVNNISPQAKLHITQNAAASNILLMEHKDSTGFGRFALYNDAGFNNRATFTRYGSKHTGTYPGLGTQFPYANLLAFGCNVGSFLVSTNGKIGLSVIKSGTSKLKFFADSNLNVGIGGNAHPARQIHFNNTDASYDTLLITNNGSGHTANDGLFIANNGNQAYIINKENSNLFLGTNNKQDIAINNLGNVGINQLSPLEKLHVQGNIRLDTLKTNAFAMSNNAGANKVLTSNAAGIGTWQNLPSIITDTTLDGNGTTSSPLSIAQQGANLGQILKWNGTTWAPANDSIGSINNWSLQGNTGTNSATHYIGTNDTVSLNFKVNNTPAGTIDAIKNNVSFGTNANANNAGKNNIALGKSALFNGTKDSNIVIGNDAMQHAINARNSIAIGNMAAQFDTNGINNISIGEKAGQNGSTVSSYNVTIGNNAKTENSISQYDVAIGELALQKYKYGFQNAIVGTGAGGEVDTLNFSTYIGTLAGYRMNGTSNTMMGYSAGLGDVNFGSKTTDNTGIGKSALANTSTGNKNTSVGSEALSGNKTGNSNVAIGYQAGDIGDAQNNVVLIGSEAGKSAKGNNNIYVGSWAGSSGANASGNSNVGIGTRTMYFNTTGAYNTVVGDSAAFQLTTGKNNTLLGAQTEVNNKTMAGAIGFKARSTQDSVIAIGNAFHKIAIGKTTATEILDVAGNIKSDSLIGTGNRFVLADANGVLFDTVINLDTNNTNEIQNLSLSNGTISLSNNGGTILLPDTSNTNEIQTLSKSNDTISLSNGGGFVVVNSSGNSWATSGNFGTNTDSNFVGTIDTVNLRFKVNNTNAGLIDYKKQSISFGINAGTIGTRNIVIGDSALQNNFGNSNVAIGYQAGILSDTNKGQILIGAGAGKNSKSDYNIFVGYQTGVGNIGGISGKSNIGIGKSALSVLSSGLNNVAIGENAMKSATSSIRGIAIGKDAMVNVSGINTDVIALGDSALANTYTSNGIAIGPKSLTNNTFGLSNIGIGLSTLYTNSTGSSNVAIGNNNLKAAKAGSGNTAIGHNAMILDSIGSDNTAIGFVTNRDNYTSSRNTVVGSRAMSLSKSGNNNIALGYNAALSNKGDNNTVLGYQSGMQSDSINGATMIGFNAGYNNRKSENTFIGANAAGNTTNGRYITGEKNTGIGFNTLFNILGGRENTSVGHGAMYKMKGGNFNVAIGSDALGLDSSSSNNTALGDATLSELVNGGSNVAIGCFAGQYATTAQDNVMIGANAMLDNNGNSNVAIGNAAGFACGTVNEAIMIGQYAGALNQGDENILIGRNAGFGSNNNGLTGTRNIALGNNSLLEADAGQKNIALGHGAMAYNKDGNNNVAIGDEALSGTTENSVQNNVAIGNKSMYNASTSSSNVAIGNLSLYNAGTSSTNIAIGDSSMYLANNTQYNIAMGSKSLMNVTQGSSNIAIGQNAQMNNTIGSRNTSIGRDAMSFANNDLYDNIAIGDSAMVISKSNNNIAIGSQTLKGNNSSGSNIAIGNLALTKVNIGNANVSIGHLAGSNIKNGIANTILGNQAFSQDTSGNENTVIGNYSMRTFKAGTLNTVLGSGAMEFSTIGNYNTVIGSEALHENSGNENTVIGVSAAYQADSVNNSTIIGYRAGYNIKTWDNTFIGHRSAGNSTAGRNITGAFNTAVGGNSMRDILGGSDNVALGRDVYYKLSNGSYNTAIGSIAMSKDTTAINNTALGFNAGGDFVNGNNNVFIGANANAIANGISNSIAIGSFAKVSSSNAIILGDSNNTNLKVGIGVTNPLQKLHLKGNAYFNGKVGIGNVAGNYPLEVSGNYNVPSLTYGYFNSAGLSGQGNFNNIPVSIRASDRIVASEFNAVSDARVKNIKGISNNQKDLNTLAKIEITDYKFIDTIGKGNKEYKKVIAQQVASVYPNAVNQISDYIPNIYSLSNIRQNKFKIPNIEKLNIKANDKLKLITASGEVIVNIVAINGAEIQIDHQEIEGDVFVFGTQICDFHTVDYEALTTLNMSATQALLQEINLLKMGMKIQEDKAATLQQQLNAIAEKINILTNSTILTAEK